MQEHYRKINYFKIKDVFIQKAKKKSIQLNSEISESEYIQNVSISIRFDKNQLEHVICNHTQEVYEIIYSEKFLNTLNNNIQLFHVFSQIFIFLD